MQLNNKKTITLVLFFAFIFSLGMFTGTANLSQASTYEIIDGYQEWTADRTISTKVIINPDATLVIKKGVTVTFAGGDIDIEGTLITKGTISEKVKFVKASSSKNYSIQVRSVGKVILRNTDVSGSGRGVYWGFADAGIAVRGGWLDVTGSSFHDNNIPISIDNQNLSRIRVNKSKFFNNSSYNVYYNGNSGNQVNFKYNWWGSAEGPKKICYTSCYYDGFEKNVDFSNWLTEEEFKDPVIIIPGIMGSWEKDGVLQIDPIFHTYDNLYTAFANNGYVPEKDLFVFPYEWRDSNIENAKKLKSKIDAIKQQQNWPTVDIVAHSMGGLLAREYVEADYYGSDVDQLITLATPNLGAPEAYTKWDGDGWFFSLSDLYMHRIVKQEAEESGFSSVFDYLHNRPVASLKELLPVYSYLYDIADNNSLRVYPNLYPRNEFLEALNAKSNRLDSIEYNKIIGNISGNNTISGMNVVLADMGKYWIHGYPLGFEIPIGDRGMQLSRGDRTVPIDSARSVDIKSDTSIELASDHRSIVTDAQKEVLELLTNIRPETEVRRSLIRNIFFVQVFSPVDIQIIAPDGKWSGKNIRGLDENEQIEGAYYTGYDTDTEFLTIPNPSDGEYKILTQGTGEGEYRIEATKISEDAGDPQRATESTEVIEGVATDGHEEEVSVEVRGDEVLAGDKVPPTVTINDPGENETYRNDQILHISYAAEDNKTAPENMVAEIFWDDVKLESADVDLSLQKLGQHKVKIGVTDEAGNAAEKEAVFSVFADIDSIIANIDHYSALGMFSDQKTEAILLKKTTEIKYLMFQLERLKATKNRHHWFVERFISAWERLINHKIDKLIGKIQGRKGNYSDDSGNDRADYKNNLLVAQPAKDLLVESLRSIKY